MKNNINLRPSLAGSSYSKLERKSIIENKTKKSKKENIWYRQQTV